MSKVSITKGMARQEFLDEVHRYNPHADLSLVGRAYDFALAAHTYQKRANGDDFFTHVTEVAYLLATLRLDSESICAGLLHDTLEDTKTKPEEIERQFGRSILSLVEGVTKIASIDLDVKEKEAENIRKVVLATTKDIRVIMVKLADRLHNMRTLRYLEEAQQRRISQETLDIYAPIAYKLGMYRLKSELEDLCLKYLEPEAYQDIKRKVVKKQEEREQEVRKIVEGIREKLLEKDIRAKVDGRAKHFYSIYKKIAKKNKRFEELFDLYAIRIVTESADDCYRALGVIHASWTPIPEHFHDYIATPKPNMYQSLHTDILFDKKPVEVQIRTWEMHHTAEEGIAAHWAYKDTERDKEFDKRISWLKQILDWQRSSSTAAELIETMKIDLFKDEIIVLTPKGDPIPLPEGATPVDFAYMVHTDIGNHCVRAKVNNAIMPLDHELKSGDVVEIVTEKKARPSRSWLSFVKTNSANQKIRQTLNIRIEREKKPEDTPLSEQDILHKIDTQGIKLSSLKVSKCCNPTYPDSIIGFRMKDGKIAVHKEACVNIKAFDERRKIRFSWIEEAKHQGKLLELEIVDRVGLLADVLNILAKAGISISSIQNKAIKDRMFLLIELKAVPDNVLNDVLPVIKAVRSVADARVKGSA